MRIVKTRKILDSLTAYVPGERRRDAIKLSSNENPRGSSPRALEAIRASLDEAHFYPDGATRELKTALARHYGCEPDHIVLGNGSDEILTMIAATYLNPGDRVLVGQHSFSQYAFSARLFDARVVPVAMPNLDFDLELVLQAIENETRIVYLCSPNNPTGIAIAQKGFDSFLDRVPTDILVVVDHAYQEYVDDKDALVVDRYVTGDGGLTNAHGGDGLSNAHGGARPNLIVLHTFSKLYGLAALRVGYGIAAPERIREIEKVRSPFNVNSLALAAATAALEDTTFAAESLAVNRAGKLRMAAILDDLDLPYLPTQANFVAVEVPEDAKIVAGRIAENGITVRALTSFGLPRHLRITIGTDQQIDQLELILRQIFRGS